MTIFDNLQSNSALGEVIGPDRSCTATALRRPRGPPIVG
jgi:hypothetical protein